MARAFHLHNILIPTAMSDFQVISPAKGAPLYDFLYGSSDL
jgi:hypothetical protein